jgi:hypothetical protein
MKQIFVWTEKLTNRTWDTGRKIVHIVSREANSKGLRKCWRDVTFWIKFVGSFCFTGTVTGKTLFAEARGKLMPEISILGGKREWWMHNGAARHCALSVRHWLDQTLLGLWINRKGTVEWAPRLPDLNPLEHPFWACQSFWRDSCPTTNWRSPPVHYSRHVAQNSKQLEVLYENMSRDRRWTNWTKFMNNLVNKAYLLWFHTSQTLCISTLRYIHLQPTPSLHSSQSLYEGCPKSSAPFFS